jgi:hypothetical protein
MSTILVNVAIVGLVYLVFGFRVVAIVGWVARRFLSQLRTSATVLVRAVPLLLFFSLVIFFTQEIWQVFTASGVGTYWAAISMFVLLAAVLVSVDVRGIWLGDPGCTLVEVAFLGERVQVTYEVM